MISQIRSLSVQANQILIYATVSKRKSELLKQALYSLMHPSCYGCQPVNYLGMEYRDQRCDYEYNNHNYIVPCRAFSKVRETTSYLQRHSFRIQNLQLFIAFQSMAPLCNSFASLGVGLGVRTWITGLPEFGMDDGGG